MAWTFFIALQGQVHSAIKWASDRTWTSKIKSPKAKTPQIQPQMTQVFRLSAKSKAWTQTSHWHGRSAGSWLKILPTSGSQQLDMKPNENSYTWNYNKEKNQPIIKLHEFLCFSNLFFHFMTSTLTLFIGSGSQLPVMPQVPVLWDLVEAAAHCFREALVLVWHLQGPLKVP